MKTAVDGVILIDSAGIVLLFNPACERLFQFRADEVLGRNVKMLMPPGHSEQHDSYIDNLHRTGHGKIIGKGRELAGLRKDGTSFPMHLSVGESNEDGESFFVGIIHDLSERNKMEEQLIQAQKMETVGQLSGGIAHDFNNLLTVIVGNAECLSDQLQSRRDLQMLADDIGRAGERGAELTQRLLAFSRRQTLQPIEVDCNELVDSMHKLLRRTLREDIAIRTDFDPELRQAYADRSQLESAVLNLALNAQGAMEAGGRLSITTANVSLDGQYHALNPEVQPGDYVLIAVTDNGEGMPKNVLDRAFEPFFTTKEVGKGSGLGLSMVYGFVKQSNGHVSIYSEPGLGTTVRLYLPALAGNAKPALQPDETSMAPDIERKTVLVVEDDPFVRSYAVMCLRSLGYTAISAVDGTDALQKLGSDAHIDILFTDIVMPGGTNGFDLAERAGRMRPAIRVLLTSGYALETMAAHGRLSGDAMVLTKPYRKIELARLLRQVSEQRV